MRISDWSSDVCSSDLSRSNLFGGKFAAGPTVPPEYVGRTSWSNFSGTLDNDSFGMYGQLNYELTDALSITGGLRYSIDDKRRSEERREGKEGASKCRPRW